MDFNSLCVIGMGYIGLPTASVFARAGMQVVGMDTNIEIINRLQAGEPHIYEPGLRELVVESLNSGRLTISQDVCPADAYIIAVPTPFYEDKHADMRAVQAACESIVPHLQEGNLVILESTSPPRTTVDLAAPILEKSGLKAGVDFLLAYSPERVLPGKILSELIENPRVIGGITPQSAQAGSDLYRKFVKGEIILTDATTAEMVKLMENTSRDINIAIANEFSRLAEDFNVDIWEAIQIANLHPRVNILQPGVGVGGHCISVDPWFLVEAAPESAHLIRTSRQVNDGQPGFVCGLIEQAADTVEGKKIGFLGLSFKPDVDDLRESPAVELARLLSDKGGQVLAYEPFSKASEVSGIKLAASLGDAIGEADLIVLAVAHSQFKNLDPDWMKKNTKAHLVFDTAHTWVKPTWEKAGFDFFGLARNH